MGRAQGLGEGVWLGINPGTVGFLLLSCCPLSRRPAPCLSFIVSFHSRSLQSWDSSSDNSCGISLFGAPAQGRNHADVFGAGVGSPPGNR